MPPRIEPRAQLAVDPVDAGLAAIHGRDHLDVGERVQPESLRDPLGHDAGDRVQRVERIVAVVEEEIALAGRLPRESWHLAGEDPVRPATIPEPAPWRNTRFSRTTGTVSLSMRSWRKFPGPTEGN